MNRHLTFLAVVLAGCASAAAAEVIDAMSLQSGTRAEAEGVELLGQFAAIGALDVLGDVYMASGYIGQTANQTPTVDNPGAQILAANGSAAITLTAADRDGDQVLFTIVAEPSHGTLSGNGPDFIYTPDVDYRGMDSFQIFVHDGGDRSPTLTVSLQIGGDRRIHIRIQPDPTGLLEVEAQALDDSDALRVPYILDLGATFPALDSDLGQRLIWIFAGDG